MAAKKRDAVDWIFILVAFISAITGVVFWVTGTSEKDAAAVRSAVSQDIERNTADLKEVVKDIDTLSDAFYEFKLSYEAQKQKLAIFFGRQQTMETQLSNSANKILKLEWRVQLLEGGTTPPLFLAPSADEAP